MLLTILHQWILMIALLSVFIWMIQTPERALDTCKLKHELEMRLGGRYALKHTHDRQYILKRICDDHEKDDAYLATAEFLLRDKENDQVAELFKRRPPLDEIFRSESVWAFLSASRRRLIRFFNLVRRFFQIWYWVKRVNSNLEGDSKSDEDYLTVAEFLISHEHETNDAIVKLFKINSLPSLVEIFQNDAVLTYLNHHKRAFFELANARPGIWSALKRANSKHFCDDEHDGGYLVLVDFLLPDDQKFDEIHNLFNITNMPSLADIFKHESVLATLTTKKQDLLELVNHSPEIFAWLKDINKKPLCDNDKDYILIVRYLLHEYPEISNLFTITSLPSFKDIFNPTKPFCKYLNKDVPGFFDKAEKAKDQLLSSGNLAFCKTYYSASYFEKVMRREVPVMRKRLETGRTSPGTGSGLAERCQPCAMDTAPAVASMHTKIQFNPIQSPEVKTREIARREFNFYQLWAVIKRANEDPVCDDDDDELYFKIVKFLLTQDPDLQFRLEALPKLSEIFEDVKIWMPHEFIELISDVKVYNIFQKSSLKSRQEVVMRCRTTKCNTMLHFLVRETNQEARKLAWNVCCESKCLDYLVNVQNSNGDIALHLLCKKMASPKRADDDKDLLKLLLDVRVANVNIQNKDGDTPAHIVLRDLSSSLEDIQPLLNYKHLCRSITNKNGETPESLLALWVQEMKKREAQLKMENQWSLRRLPLMLIKLRVLLKKYSLSTAAAVLLLGFLYDYYRYSNHGRAVRN